MRALLLVCILLLAAPGAAASLARVEAGADHFEGECEDGGGSFGSRTDPDGWKHFESDSTNDCRYVFEVLLARASLDDWELVSVAYGREDNDRVDSRYTARSSPDGETWESHEARNNEGTRTERAEVRTAFTEELEMRHASCRYTASRDVSANSDEVRREEFRGTETCRVGPSVAYAGHETGPEVGACTRTDERTFHDDQDGNSWTTDERGRLDCTLGATVLHASPLGHLRAGAAYRQWNTFDCADAEACTRDGAGHASGGVLLDDGQQTYGVWVERGLPPLLP